MIPFESRLIHFLKKKKLYIKKKLVFRFLKICRPMTSAPPNVQKIESPEHNKMTAFDFLKIHINRIILSDNTPRRIL